MDEKVLRLRTLSMSPQKKLCDDAKINLESVLATVVETSTYSEKYVPRRVEAGGVDAGDSRVRSVGEDATGEP